MGFEPDIFSGENSTVLWGLLVFAVIVVCALWKGGKLSKLSIAGASAEFASGTGVVAHAEVVLVVCVPESVPWWQVRVDLDGVNVADLNLSDRGGEHVAARLTLAKPGTFHYSAVATGSRRGVDAEGNPTLFDTRSTGAGTINIVPGSKLVVDESIDLSGGSGKFRLSLLTYENWSNRLPPADVQRRQLDEVFENA